MAYALSRLERIYAQVESSFGQVPNSGGTATVSGSNACRFTKFSADNDVAVITRPDKTGSRSIMLGVKGRGFGKWSVDMSVAPNGTPGTVPDADPFLQGLIGQAGSVKSGTATVSAASNASPIAITTSAAHSFEDNDVVSVSGVGGNTAANGIWAIHVVDSTHFELIGSTGNAAYTTGGSISQAVVKYSLSDNIPSLSLWSFRQPSTIDQRVSIGSVVQEGTFQLGDDVASMSFNGESMWVLSSNQFADSDTQQKGGLSAFPSEPGSAVTNGNMVAGFTGKIVAGGEIIASIRTAQIRIQNGNVTIKDLFGSYYPTSVEGDERNVGISFSLYEDDTDAFKNLIQASNDKTPLNFTMQIGTQIGSIFVAQVNNVQLLAPSREEQRRFIANFPESRAKASALTAKDECVLWWF